MSTTLELPIAGHVRPADAYIIALSFAALAVVFYVGRAIYIAYFGPLSKFPGPPLRAISKMPQIRDMISGDDNLNVPALHKKYGPVVRVGPNELSFAAGAQSWKDIYGFKTHSQPKPYKDPFFYGKPLNGVPSIITADDANHARQRKILSHSFADKSLKDQEPMLKKWAGLMKDKLAAKAKPGEKADMLKYYNCTTFDIMGVLAFSESLNMLEESEYSPWVKTIFAGIKNGTLFRGIKLYSAVTNYLVEQLIFKSKFARQKQFEHWNYTKERVDRRLKKNPEHPDLWTKILERSDGPEALTVDEHHSIGSLFMVAGTETTATALSGTTYHLLRNPEYLKKLNQEIRSSFSDFESLNLEDLARQKYLMAVLQEGLRMYPPVPITLPRRAPKDGMAIAGEWVPGDTVVGVHQLSTYRMEKHFKYADEFHPERWLGDKEFENDHLDAMEPFSTGPRNCLGKNLAWHEMRLLLATVVLHFDLELCPESHDWAQQKVYTLWEKKILMCNLMCVKA